MKTTEKKTRSMNGGWQLVFYGPEKKYRAYIKGSYTIRQRHHNGGSPMGNSWELVNGNNIIAHGRTRAEVKRIAEERFF